MCASPLPHASHFSSAIQVARFCEADNATLRKFSMNVDRLKEYYEEDAARFWDPTSGMTGRDLDVYPLLAGLSGRVLEYGCGSGSLVVALAREERFTHCIGVDISENALAAIRGAWDRIDYPDKKKLNLIRPQSDHLPDIASGSIDVVISVATVEHVLNPYIVLDELHRVAKHDAVFVCSVPNYAYVKHRVALLLGKQPKTGTDEPVEKWRTEGWDGMHLHTFTKSSFAVLLNDCGWLPYKWTGCGTRFNSIGFGALRRRYPGLLSGELIAVCKKR
jgi:SAM-dependent methyltransferase